VVAEAGVVDVTASLRAAEDPEEVWDAMTMPTRRAVVRAVMSIRVLRGTPGRLHGLRFHDDSVRIEWLRP